MLRTPPHPQRPLISTGRVRFGCRSFARKPASAGHWASRPGLRCCRGTTILFGPDAFNGLHLAVVGGCEGEATLLARWVRDRRADLEQMLGLRAVSLTWLASDIVPAGCLSYAALQAVPVLSQQWIVIATNIGSRIVR